MADFKNLKRHNTLGAPPPIDEASDNLSAPETAPAPPPAAPAAPPEKAQTAPRRAKRAALAPIAIEQGRGHRDGRSLRRTGRTLQLATRVSPEFDARLRAIAEREGMLIVEVLEEALDAYESKR